MFGRETDDSKFYLSNYIQDPLTKKQKSISIHSGNYIGDFGLNVIDPKCWERMLRFFRSLLITEKIQIKHTFNKNQTWLETTEVIANLNFLDYEDFRNGRTMFELILKSKK